MNERFLFRGKRKDNGKWVYGWLRSLHSYDPQTKQISSIYFTEISDDLRSRADIIVDYKTVGQCTGLEDKNGKLIFEGDILKFVNDDDESSLYVVIWNTSLLSWQVQEISYYVKNDYYGFDELCEFGDTEVIGNVYDNPELLQRSDE